MIWISLTVMICSLFLSVASLRASRGDALGIPLIAIGTFAYLYVAQPVQLLLAGTYSLFVTDWQMSEGFLIPAIMLACFIWGWMCPRQTATPAKRSWDPQELWRAGFVIACLGLIIYAFFLERSGGISQAFSKAHGAAIKYDSNTAYIYDAPLWMLSGSVMMFLGRSTRRNERWKNVAPHVFLCLYLLQSPLTGSRGALFSGAMTYFVGYSIARRKKVTFWQVTWVLLPVSIGVLAMVGYRNFLHLGDKPTEELPSVESAYNANAGVSESDIEHDFTGQEFLYHTVQMNTVDQTGKLDYGLNWIEFLVINPIPKLIWPEKAYPPSGAVTWEDIKEHTSLTIASGSACGIVADIYARFQMASTVFFFGLGFGLRRLFIAARNFNSLIAVVGYILIYAASLNMFGQGFSTIFVFLGYSMAPVLAFAWLARGSRRMKGGRQRQLIVSRIAPLSHQTVALHGDQWSS